MKSLTGTNIRPPENPINVVYDDLGYAWYFRKGKIRMIDAEQECKTKAEREENGYYCDNLQDGIRVLKEFGYITEEER